MAKAPTTLIDLGELNVCVRIRSELGCRIGTCIASPTSPHTTNLLLLFLSSLSLCSLAYTRLCQFQLPFYDFTNYNARYLAAQRALLPTFVTGLPRDRLEFLTIMPIIVRSALYRYPLNPSQEFGILSLFNSRRFLIVRRGRLGEIVEIPRV